MVSFEQKNRQNVLPVFLWLKGRLKPFQTAFFHTDLFIVKPFPLKESHPSLSQQAILLFNHEATAHGKYKK